MPTSATGSRRRAAAVLAPPNCRRAAGFTLLELLVVLAVIAVGVALVTLALPDGDSARLEEEGARLTALLETARAEARVSGMPVLWIPRPPGEGLVDIHGEPVHFRFVGLPAAMALPSRWMDARVSAQVAGSGQIVLGPGAILPAQRIVLTLAERRLELRSDGLGPFTVAEAPR
jgi:general secretion pathway protein H